MFNTEQRFPPYDALILFLFNQNHLQRITGQCVSFEPLVNRVYCEHLNDTYLASVLTVTPEKETDIKFTKISMHGPLLASTLNPLNMQVIRKTKYSKDNSFLILNVWSPN